MNLAILHHHLNRGGVTRVIENQLLALDTALGAGEPWHVALVYGGRRLGFREDLPEKLKAVRLSLHEVPALDYDQEQKALAGGGSKSLAEQLTDLLGEIGFAPGRSIVHVHNHSLVRNVSLLPGLMRLAGAGYPLLLQLHDFAEDFRASNYARLCEAASPGRPPAAALYPQAPHIHYAVLNGRDFDVMRAAGVSSERLVRLPNPVPKMDGLPSKDLARRRLAERFGVDASQRFILYPVRCIRRKNVGEALLHAALARSPDDTAGSVVGLTLPPLNPAEASIYEGWKRVAAELDLPCRFDVGGPDGLSFAENLAAADLILTTSLAEGFGMVFLESWLTGLPLIGRDLPEITRDFTAMGVRFDWLHSRLEVPVDWIGADKFRQTVLDAYRRTLRAYGRHEPEDLAQQAQAKVRRGFVDFGDLDETLQEQVLRTVGQSDANRRRVLKANAWVESALSIRADETADVIRHNAQVISQQLSLHASGHRLLQLYAKVAASRRDGHPGSTGELGTLSSQRDRIGSAHPPRGRALSVRGDSSLYGRKRTDRPRAEQSLPDPKRSALASHPVSQSVHHRAQTRLLSFVARRNPERGLGTLGALHARGGRGHGQLDDRKDRGHPLIGRQDDRTCPKDASQNI